jgi:hypothetical protein
VGLEPAGVGRAGRRRTRVVPSGSLGRNYSFRHNPLPKAQRKG